MNELYEGVKQQATQYFGDDPRLGAGDSNATKVPEPMISDFEKDDEGEEVFGMMQPDEWVKTSANLQGETRVKAQALRARFAKKNGSTDKQAADYANVPDDFTTVDKSPIAVEMIRGGWNYTATMAGGAAAGIEKITGSETFQDVKEEAAEYVKNNEDRDIFNNYYNAEYDEDDGSRSKDWNVAGGVGEMVVPAKLGMTIDGMVSSKAKSVVANAMYSSAEVASGYAIDSDKTAAGVGVAAVALEGIVGMLMPDGYNTLAKTGKSMEAMQDSLYAAQLLDSAGFNIPKAVFDDPDKLAGIIKEANRNIFERGGTKIKLNAAQLNVVEQIQDTARAFNLTPTQLNQYLKGDIPLEATSKIFKDYVESDRLVKTAKAKHHYEKASKMDIDANGVPNKYDSSLLMRDLFRETENAPQVENILAAALKHKGRIESEDAFEARQITDNFAEVSETLKKKQAELVNTDRKIQQYSLRLRDATENTSEASLVSWSNKLNDARAAKSRLETEIKPLKSEKGKALQAYRAFKEKLPVVDDSVYDIEKFKRNLSKEMSLQEAQDLSVYINHKINVAGGAISVNDTTQIGKLKNVRSRLKGFIESKAMEIDADGNLVNPGAAEFLKEVKQGDVWTSKKYQLSGRDQGIEGLDAALKSRDVEALGKLMQGPEAYSRLKYLKTVNKGENKEMFDQLSNVWAHNEIMKDVPSPSKPGAPTIMDFSQLAKNLNKPNLMHQLDNIDPDAAKGARALKSLVNAYTQSLTELQKVSPSLGPDEGVLTKLKTFFSKVGSPIQGLRYIGRNAGSAIWDPAAKAMGSGSRWQPLDEKATWNTAIKQITAEMSGVHNPKAKADRFGKIIESIIDQVGDTIHNVDSTTRPGFINFSKASTELTPTGKPFDLRRIAPEDQKLMGQLKAGDTVRDMGGNLYRKEITKGTQWTEVDNVPERAPKLKVSSLGDPAVAKAKGFVEVDGKYYKRQKVEREKWVPAQNTEQAKLQVDSTEKPGEDFTAPIQRTGEDTKVVSEEVLNRHKHTVSLDTENYNDALLRGNGIKRTAKAARHTVEKHIQLKGGTPDEAIEYADLHLAAVEDRVKAIKAQDKVRELKKGADLGEYIPKVRHVIDLLAPWSARVPEDFEVALALKGNVTDLKTMLELEDLSDSEIGAILLKVQALGKEYQAAQDAMTPAHKTALNEAEIALFDAKHSSSVAKQQLAAYSNKLNETIAERIGEGKYKTDVSKYSPQSLQTSSLDDAVYKLRLSGKPVPKNTQEWLTYLKNSGASYDELEGSKVAEKLQQMEEFGMPQTLENVETALNDRWDQMAMGTMPTEEYKSYWPGRQFGSKLSKENYKENVYVSKQNEPTTKGVPSIHLPVKDYTSHVRISDYITPDGEKGRVIGEVQSDMFQNLKSDGKITGETAGELSEELREYMHRPSQHFSMRDMATKLDISTDTLGDEIAIMDSYLKNVGMTSTEKDKYIDILVNNNVNAGLRYLGQLGLGRSSEIQARGIVLTHMKNMVNKYGTFKPKAKIPHSQDWMQDMLGDQLVRAYNDGVKEVTVPIGRFHPDKATTRNGNVVWTSEGASYSKVASDMVREAGPTKWYVESVMPALRKMGIGIKVKDITYNPDTEMLTIKMPDKPFTISRKGVGEVPSE